MTHWNSCTVVYDSLGLLHSHLWLDGTPAQSFMTHWDSCTVIYDSLGLLHSHLWLNGTPYNSLGLLCTAIYDSLGLLGTAICSGEHPSQWLMCHECSETWLSCHTSQMAHATWLSGTPVHSHLLGRASLAVTVAQHESWLMCHKCSETWRIWHDTRLSPWRMCHECSETWLIWRDTYLGHLSQWLSLALSQFIEVHLVFWKLM